MNETDRYALRFAQILGVTCAYPFWQGRMAFYVILKALGVKEGDEVLIPAYTCTVVPSMVMALRATPIYCDIKPGTYHLDPEKVQRNISSRTRAVVLQHTYGILQDPEPLQSLIQGRGIALIEDAAHSLGSTLKGNSAGTLTRASFISTQWTKIFSTGLGGIAATSDKELSSRIEYIYKSASPPGVLEMTRLRTLVLGRKLFGHPSLYWWNLQSYLLLQKFGLAPKTFDSETSFQDGRMFQLIGLSEFQARLGLKELERLPQNIAHRKKLAQLYSQTLQTEFACPEQANPALLYYPLHTRDKSSVLKEAEKRNLEVDEWPRSPVHPLPLGTNGFGYQSGSCPVAEETARQTVVLPTHSGIRGGALEKILAFLNESRSQGWLASN